MFSYVLLCDFNELYKADFDTSEGLAIAIPEVILIIWVTTFALELFRKVLILLYTYIFCFAIIINIILQIF